MKIIDKGMDNAIGNMLRSAANHKAEYRRHVFGDTVLCVPERYINVEPRGVGAQGIVW